MSKVIQIEVEELKLITIELEIEWGLNEILHSSFNEGKSLSVTQQVSPSKDVDPQSGPDVQ